MNHQQALAPLMPASCSRAGGCKACLPPAPQASKGIAWQASGPTPLTLPAPQQHLKQAPRQVLMLMLPTLLMQMALVAARQTQMTLARSSTGGPTSSLRGRCWPAAVAGQGWCRSITSEVRLCLDLSCCSPLSCTKSFSYCEQSFICRAAGQQPPAACPAACMHAGLLLHH